MLALEGRPAEWNNGSLLPADPRNFNETGFMSDPLTENTFRVWRRIREFLSVTGTITWQFGLYDITHTGPSIAEIPIKLDEHTSRYGRDRFLMLVRPGDEYQRQPDIPGADERVLIFSDAEWNAFVGGAWDGEFDLKGPLDFVRRLALDSAVSTPRVIDSTFVEE